MKLKLNLKLKVILFVAAIFIISSAIYLFVEIRQYDKNCDWSIAREEQALDTVVTLLTKYHLAPYQNRLKEILGHEEVLMAFADRDRDLLYQLAFPSYKTLEINEYGLPNMHYHLPDGSSFLRMHAPGHYGDNLSGVRPLINRVHDLQETMTAFEVGRRGGFYRIVEPIFWNGEYIGAVELGVPVETFASSIREQLNVPTVLFFDTEHWEKATRSEKQLTQIGRYTVFLHEDPDFCLIGGSTDLEKDRHLRLEENGRTCILHSLPIFKDFQSKLIGGILICQDITPFLQKKSEAIRASIILVAILFASSMSIVYVILGRLMDSIENFQQEQNRLVIKLESEIAERRKSEKQRLQLQGQLLQSQKMEALGLLSGGVAHDFNNLLTTILGYTQLILRKHDLDPIMQGRLKAIFAAGDRAAELVRQLLAFSRSQPLEMHPVNVSLVVQNMGDMIKRLIGEDIELILNITARGCLIKADQSQVEQILMNLAVNARDAMPHGGKLTITAKKLTVDDAYNHDGMQPGTYVMLIVTDTGSGMSPEIQEKIFDPFFTTKPVGKGTGLGLSTVYGIVKQHDGIIQVKTEIGKGTSFISIFPLYISTGKVTSVPVKQHLSKGNETILVVEDELALQDVIEDMLISLGYQVILAKDGHEAIDKFVKQKDEIDLLLTDLVMPEMSGLNLSKKLQQINPQLKILYMSGYSGEILKKYGIDTEKVNFLHKPLTIGSVSQSLRSVFEDDKELEKT